MEFLMTYGWAILIMLVVIAILFMLGVFNPAGSVPESCVLPAGFSCYSYSIDSTGKLYLDLGQAKGRRISIRALTCSAEEVPEPQTITTISIENGRHKVVAEGVQCVDENGDPYTVGDSFRGKIVFTYSEFGSDLTRTATGDISGKMEGTIEGGGGGGGETPTPTPTPTATPPFEGCTPRQLTIAGTEPCALETDGNRLVYAAYDDGGDRDIYVYDLSMDTETKLNDDDVDQCNPEIYGDRVVWTDWRNDGDEDIYMYDLGSETETRITDEPDEQGNPSIYGDIIAWVDNRNNKDVYMYDIGTGQETLLTTYSNARAGRPKVYANYIVWNDRADRNNEDVYVYDIGAGTATNMNLADDPNDQFRNCRAQFSGNTLFWLEADVNLPNYYQNRSIVAYPFPSGPKSILVQDGVRGGLYVGGSTMVWSERNDQDWTYSLYARSTFGGTPILLRGPDNSEERAVVLNSGAIAWIEDNENLYVCE